MYTRFTHEVGALVRVATAPGLRPVYARLAPGFTLTDETGLKVPLTRDRKVFTPTRKLGG
jgi:hypothetical protein